MEITKHQKDRADKFQRLHKDSNSLILPCAWDCCSAKIFENEGFKAIGTTSAGISVSIGYPDGQKMSLEENLSTVKRIANCINVPLSVDIEAGYSLDMSGIVNAASLVLSIGGVGINIEDSTGSDINPLFDIQFQMEKIKAIREMANSHAIDLLINARTDVYLNSNIEDKFNESIRRANQYIEAGADCIFIPDMKGFDTNLISNLVKEVDGPINILAGPNNPPVNILEELGVARISLGSSPMRSVYSHLKAISTEILKEGTYNNINKSNISYSEINSLYSK